MGRGRLLLVVGSLPLLLDFERRVFPRRMKFVPAWRHSRLIGRCCPRSQRITGAARAIAPQT